MAQRIRRQKNRNKVKGVAIRKNNNPNVGRKITVSYGNVKVTTYGRNKNKNKKRDENERAN